MAFTNSHKNRVYINGCDQLVLINSSNYDTAKRNTEITKFKPHQSYGLQLIDNLDTLYGDVIIFDGKRERDANTCLLSQATGGQLSLATISNLINDNDAATLTKLQSSTDSQLKTSGQFNFVSTEEEEEDEVEGVIGCLDEQDIVYISDAAGLINDHSYYSTNSPPPCDKPRRLHRAEVTIMEQEKEVCEWRVGGELDIDEMLNICADGMMKTSEMFVAEPEQVNIVDSQTDIDARGEDVGDLSLAKEFPMIDFDTLISGGSGSDADDAVWIEESCSSDDIFSSVVDQPPEVVDIDADISRMVDIGIDLDLEVPPVPSPPSVTSVAAASPDIDHLLTQIINDTGITPPADTCPTDNQAHPTDNQSHPTDNQSHPTDNQTHTIIDLTKMFSAQARNDRERADRPRKRPHTGHSLLADASRRKLMRRQSAAYVSEYFTTTDSSLPPTNPVSVFAKPPAPFISKPPAPVISKPPAQVISKPPAQVISKPPAQVISKPPAQVISKPPAQVISKTIPISPSPDCTPLAGPPSVGVDGLSSESVSYRVRRDKNNEASRRSRASRRRYEREMEEEEVRLARENDRLRDMIRALEGEVKVIRESVIASLRKQ